MSRTRKDAPDSRNDKKATKAQRDAINQAELTAFEKTGTFSLTGDPLVGQTAAQKRYICAMQKAVYTFGDGPAGTGKTHAAVNLAIELMAAGKINGIIVTRPAVTAGEDMGHLPGELEEKFAPYLVPIIEILRERVNPGVLGYLIRSGKIEAVPVGFCRGRSFKNKFIIVDEAQNTTPEQMKMLLTRVGVGSTMVINGDPGQQDTEGPCGMVDAIKKVGKLRCTTVVKFTKKDCLRSGAVKDVLECYEEEPVVEPEGTLKLVA